MSKRKRSKNKLKPAKVRNKYAFDPLMKKGGVHEKTTKAKRQKDKQNFKRELKKLPFDVSGAYFLITTLTAFGNVCKVTSIRG